MSRRNDPPWTSEQLHNACLYGVCEIHTRTPREWRRWQTGPLEYEESMFCPDCEASNG